MWKRVLKFSNYCELRSITTRTYLSEAYKLNDEWNQRLKTPLLEKINPDTLFVDLSSKYQQKRQLAAIDIDIYVNKVNKMNVEEAMELTQKFRTTEKAHEMLDSTSHALIRLLENDPEVLLNVLNRRLDYGVFPDTYILNALFDKFIKEKNYMVAARLATLQMLQEDFENPITRYMSLYACYKFLDNIETFVDLVPPKPLEVEENKQQEQKGGKSAKKKVEEIKIRVRYIRNPYFDDHFDITDTNHLLGKTFLYLADEVRNADEILANSLELVGYALYQKYEKGCEFLKGNKSFYKEIVDKVKAFAEKVENLDETGKTFYEEVNTISTQKEGDVNSIIEGFLKQAVSENESKIVEEQKKNYTIWVENREKKLKEELQRLERIKRLEDIEKLQADMETEERKLWFFEDQEKHKLEIQRRKAVIRNYPKYIGKKKKPRAVDENYVPPEIDNITRSNISKAK